MRIVLVLLLSCAAQAGEAAPRLLAEGAVGSGRARLDDAAWAPDGASVYAVGRDDAAGDGPWLGVAGSLAWGHGLLIRFDAGTGRLLSQVRFAAGSFLPTAVDVAPDGAVYVAGYGAPELVPVLAGHGGLITAPSFAHLAWPMAVPPEQHTDPLFLPANRGGGVPLVLRLPADLARIEAATWLEGWQSVWHVPRPLIEDLWQPVGVQVLAEGDVAVLHDGGFQRAPGAGGVHPLDYYDAPDHLSRLSGDLRTRRWRVAVATPRVDKAAVDRHRTTGIHFSGTPPIVWDRAWLGQTRSLRLRRFGDDLLLAGVSPTRTAEEPWWSPFLWRIAGDGSVRWKAWDIDPMSGPGERLGGLVSDAGVFSAAGDGLGRVLAATFGDGGNSVLLRDPRDWTRQTAVPPINPPWAFRGRALYWGTTAVLDGSDGAPRATRCWHGLVAPATGRPTLLPAWAQDLAGLDDGRVVVIGRQYGGFRTSPDAWTPDAVGGFLALLPPDLGDGFITTLPGWWPQTVIRRGDRAVIVGRRVGGDIPGPASRRTPVGDPRMLPTSAAWMLVALPP